jgi:RNA polymerase sigma factor (sigma-70 family)
MMDFTGTRSKTTFSRATDGELFALMAERDPASKEAWAEFYRRYVEDFHQLVCRLRGVPQARIDGLVQDTMIQAYRAARTFKEGDVSDAAASRRHTLTWLCRIARNLHWYTLRQQGGAQVISLPGQDGEDDSQLSTKGRRLSRGELLREIKDAEDMVSGGGHVSQVSRYRRLLREALDTLPERERDILVATFEYYELGKKQQRLPNAVVKRICEAYRISPACLRKLRERTLKKIRQYVEERMRPDD